MEIEKLRDIARSYYARRDIQKALADQAQNKEIVPIYVEAFGKRPDTAEYPQDIANIAAKGATSFHCSEELWGNPLELSSSLSTIQLDKLRIGWDLLLDIDCKFLEYSKIAAWLVCEALYFHGIRNFGLKFSGGSGFHIGLSFKAFPSVVHDIDIKNFFPQGPRLIAAYLKEMIKKDLAQRILELSTVKEIAAAAKKPVENLLDNEMKFNPFSILDIDTVLIASRHLYRMAYSLHERTGMASIVIKPEQIKAFHPGWARPGRVLAKQFLPEPEENEAIQLLTQAIDWQAKKEEKKDNIKISTKMPRDEPKIGKGRYELKISLDKINEDIFPPCIRAALRGMPHDGRKRVLFILINFFRNIGLSFEDIEKKLTDWNKLNYRPLKENYITTQVQWFKRQETRLPPNCNLTAYYQDIGICKPEPLCSKIKNPLNYVALKVRFSQNVKTEDKKKRRKPSPKEDQKAKVF
jgi:hypothetical protein